MHFQKNMCKEQACSSDRKVFFTKAVKSQKYGGGGGEPEHCKCGRTVEKRPVEMQQCVYLRDSLQNMNFMNKKKKMILIAIGLMVFFGAMYYLTGAWNKPIDIDRERFTSALEIQGRDFIVQRDSFLRIYKDAVKAEDYQTALTTLREADSVFYGYMQSVSALSIEEYIKPSGLFKVMNYGDIDSVDAYVYDKNDGFARLLFSIQREYVERRNEAALR